VRQDCSIEVRERLLEDGHHRGELVVQNTSHGIGVELIIFCENREREFDLRGIDCAFSNEYISGRRAFHVLSSHDHHSTATHGNRHTCGGL